MFSDLFSYFVIPTMVSISAFGVYYLLNPVKGNDIIKDVAWQSVNLYSKASIYFENLANSIEDDNEDENDDFNENQPLLSYYNYQNELEVQLGDDYNNLPEEWWKDSEKNVDLIILKRQTNNEVFKTFKNYNKFCNTDKQNWETVEKQFVQIELVQNGTCIDIHKHLDCFYLANNALFTPAFLKWYLKKWFNNTLNEDTYTLKIFDKDVNLFTLNSEQYIIITNNGYKIKNIDEESESGGSENDGSESGGSENGEESAPEYEGAQDD